MTPRFTISILTYSNLVGVKACLASVLNSSQAFNLILTANGNPEVAEYFHDVAKEFPRVRVIVNSDNQGFIEPNRFAFGLMETPFAVFLNDDVIVPSNWLDELVEPFERDLDMVATGPNNVPCSLKENFFGYGGDKYEYCEFSCAMVRRSLAVPWGLFSNYISFASCEDADFSLRMRERGYNIAKANLSIKHEVGATRRNVPGLAEIFRRNLAACQHRWADYLKSKDRKFPHER